MHFDDFLRTRAGRPWRHLRLGKVEGVHASIVALRGMRHASIPALGAAAEGLAGVQWLDKVGGISSVLGRYRAWMGWVVLGACGVVFLVLFPRYRGRAWRVLALMLLLGVGVDYGIFMQEGAERTDGDAAP